MANIKNTKLTYTHRGEKMYISRLFKSIIPTKRKEKNSFYDSIKMNTVFRNKSDLGSETEKAMAPNSSTLAWKIPWMEEPGRLHSMGSQRVGHD